MTAPLPLRRKRGNYRKPPTPYPTFPVFPQTILKGVQVGGRVRLSHGLIAELHRREPPWDDLPIDIPKCPCDYEGDRAR